jgi:Cd2+/Zn2+-exporting ATPase
MGVHTACMLACSLASSWERIVIELLGCFSFVVLPFQGSWWSGGPLAADAVHLLMLTGDSQASAARVAGELGITEVHAGLSPKDKLEQVRRLQHSGDGKRGRGVVMVGDGLNDAAALAAADVGIAIASTASAAASLAADVVVVNSNGVAAVPLLLALARETQSVIRQNLALAVGSIATLALPTVLGFVPLWAAVMMHEGATLLVALNSLRLLSYGAVPGRNSVLKGEQAAGHAHGHH